MKTITHSLGMAALLILLLTARADSASDKGKAYSKSKSIFDKILK